VRRFLRENSLSLFFLGLFLAALFAQSIAGNGVFNEEQMEHGEPTMSWRRYLVSSHFGAAVLENWQSEYLQFTLFILATVWLLQRGSNESKPLEDAGLESDEQQRIGRHAPRNAPRWARAGGWRTTLYSNSLLLVMTAIFLGSWLGQSVAAWRVYNSESTEHEQPTVSWASYLRTADFWERSLENWQSEFLAVGTMAAFTIYLRQRGSPESKPVGAPHDETGSSG
jgi:hypothetical protein